MLVPFFFLRKEKVWGMGGESFVFNLLYLRSMCEPEEADTVLE